MREGETNGRHKLTWAKVLQAREAWKKGRSSFDLSLDYGVSQSTLYYALVGKTWKGKSNGRG